MATRRLRDNLTARDGQRHETRHVQTYEGARGIPAELRGGGWVQISIRTHPQSSYTEYEFQRVIDEQTGIPVVKHARVNQNPAFSPEALNKILGAIEFNHSDKLGGAPEEALTRALGNTIDGLTRALAQLQNERLITRWTTLDGKARSIFAGPGWKLTPTGQQRLEASRKPCLALVPFKPAALVVYGHFRSVTCKPPVKIAA